SAATSFQLVRLGTCGRLFPIVSNRRSANVQPGRSADPEYILDADLDVGRAAAAVARQIVEILSGHVRDAGLLPDHHDLVLPATVSGHRPDLRGGARCDAFDYSPKMLLAGWFGDLCHATSFPAVLAFSERCQAVPREARRLIRDSFTLRLRIRAPQGRQWRC